MYGLTIERNSGLSQYQQLYEQLKNQILLGNIHPATKLSSTRQLASELNLSRSIVLEVIDQLRVEGFLETRHGSGTYVIPNLTMKKDFNMPAKETSLTPMKTDRDKPLLSFVSGIPDLSFFPRRAWNHAYTQAVIYSQDRDFLYNHPKGRYDLRVALCDYLYKMKGIKTTASHIFLTAGTSQALAILTGLTKKKRIILEDPQAGFIFDIFNSFGCSITFAEVDDQGIISQQISTEHQDFLYVTPSHQYPLGGTLPVQRRVELIKKATKSGTFIIEDDYDGEYRFRTRPIAPLQTLSPQQVVYIGSFSKILSPSLRLGFMVVPDQLITPLMNIKKRWDLLNEGFNQMAMARFINGGDIYKHIRKTLKHYNLRKSKTEELVSSILGSRWKISGNTTGLHLVIRLPGHDFSSDFKEALMGKGVHMEPVSTYCRKTSSHKDKLVLGYGHRTPDEILQGLQCLKDLLGT